MDIVNKVYKTKYISKQQIPNLFVITIILITIIDSLNKNRYLLAVLLVVPFVILLLIYIGSPVKVSNNYIQLGKKVIKWEEIDNILFTVNKVGPFIKFKTKKHNFNLFWGYYQSNIDLRKLIEDICIEKSINHVIEDRGSISRMQ